MSPKYTGDNRREERAGWYLDRRVPLSLIFAMLVQAGMVIWAIADIKKDVEVLKAGAVALHSIDMKHEADFRDALTQLRDQIKVVDDKLSRLIERSLK